MAKMLRQIDDEALERPFNKAQFIRLLKYMGPYKKNVIIALILMTIATLCSLGSTMLLSRAVDALDKGAGANPGAMASLLYNIIGMVVLAVVGALCTRHSDTPYGYCGPQGAGYAARGSVQAHTGSVVLVLRFALAPVRYWCA